MPGHTVLLGRHAGNTAKILPGSEFFRDFDKRQLTLSANDRINITFLKGLCRREARMPATENDRDFRRFLLYGFGHQNRTANHWPCKGRDTEAEPVSNFSQNGPEPIGVDGGIDQLNL